jgi:hypothetical protein
VPGDRGGPVEDAAEELALLPIRQLSLDDFTDEAPPDLRHHELPDLRERFLPSVAKSLDVGDHQIILQPELRRHHVGQRLDPLAG